MRYKLGAKINPPKAEAKTEPPKEPPKAPVPEQENGMATKEQIKQLFEKAKEIHGGKEAGQKAIQQIYADIGIKSSNELTAVAWRAAMEMLDKMNEVPF